MKFLILVMALLLSCTHTKLITQETPNRVIIKYLPTDSVTITKTIHDTINNQDTITVEKIKWRIETKKMQVIDTISKIITMHDTINIIKEIKVIAGQWKIWLISIISGIVMLGIGLLSGKTNLWKNG